MRSQSGKRPQAQRGSTRKPRQSRKPKPESLANDEDHVAVLVAMFRDPPPESIDVERARLAGEAAGVPKEILEEYIRKGGDGDDGITHAGLMRFAASRQCNSLAPRKKSNRQSGARRTEVRLASHFARMRDHGWEPGKIASWGDKLTRDNYRILCKTTTSSKNLPLACAAVELLCAHKPDTVRGNMYLLVSAGWLPNTSDKSYDRIQRLLGRLREAGALPFDWIVDTIRTTIKPSSWSGLGDFADTVKDAYRKDFWARLPEYVEIIVEKDTVAGKVSAVTQEYDVPLHPIRGYSSTSYAWNMAQDWSEIEKPITVYYLGDHDPSGRDLERNIREKLGCYAKREFAWKRLGLNPDQFAEFDITPLAPKKKDSRYRSFSDEWGDECAEVEAIPATVLRDLVRNAIESHIPSGEWERLQTVERVERETWHQHLVSIGLGTGEGGAQ